MKPHELLAIRKAYLRATENVEALKVQVILKKPPIKRVTRTQWGISRPKDSELSSLSLIEADCIEPTRNTGCPSVILRFSHWYLSASERVEQDEREEAVIESCQINSAIACTVSVGTRHLETSDLLIRINSLHQRARSANVEVYFDFGQLGPPVWMEKVHCVYDPLWFTETPWSNYWKIHGWHRERWVRRYSEEQFKSLVLLAGRYQPRFVILGHSQRFKQLRELRTDFGIEDLVR